MRYCRLCENTDFKVVLDMGKQPLVNSLASNRRNKEKEYPLVVRQCSHCHLVQIPDPVESDSIYREQDYLYFSGDMPGLSNYFKKYADELTERFIKSEDDFVVEIGSNDGTMLKNFKKGLGVDPSSNVVVRALSDGVPTLSEGFSEKVAENIQKYYGDAKIIYGNNCIAHIHDLHSVMKGVNTLLDLDGIFAVECNYWGGMVENLNYSLIYHDHYSYFSLYDWFNIARKFNLNVFDAYVTPAQGGSLRVFLSRDKRPIMDRALHLLNKEQDTSLKSYKTCQKFNDGVREKAEELGKKIKELKKKGKKIAGYGAAAKGFSILALAGITNEIDFFVDDSPAKQGKFTPVNHIPVIARHDRKDPDVFLITAPNYAETIKNKENSFKGEFITP